MARKRNRMTKQDRQENLKLQRLVREYLAANGATKGGARMGLSGLLGGTYDWDLQTQAGLLGVTVDPDSTYLHRIFARFQDVDRAKALLDRLAVSHLNPHSGKWNFNWSLGATAKYMFAQFRAEVDPILPKSKHCPYFVEIHWKRSSCPPLVQYVSTEADAQSLYASAAHGWKLRRYGKNGVKIQEESK